MNEIEVKPVKKLKPKEKPHYVNNRDFSQAVCDYVQLSNDARDNDKPIPIVPEYIAHCFLKISEGLSYKSNFIRYTYREEMVMDAVENNLRAIKNYNIEAATRTGNPNAFSYFTQISYFAFLRRIAKEKKQQDIKFKFIEKSGIEDFMALNEDEMNHLEGIDHSFVDELRSRIQRVKDDDGFLKNKIKEEKKIEKERKREGLELFTS